MLSYLEYGSGPPVIFLHGLLGSKTNMAPTAKSLAASHRTFAIDLRNHGESFHHQSMSYPIMAADIGGFMQDHDIDSATVVGHSMGGKCAMQLALSFPELIDKLIIVDIAPRAYRNPAWLAYLEAMLALDLTAITSRRQADRELSGTVPASVYRRFLLSNLAIAADGSWFWRPNLAAIFAAADELLAAVRGPASDIEALFIRGSESPYVPPEDVADIQALFPKANVVTVPGASHLVHIEARAPFRQLLVDFLSVA